MRSDFNADNQKIDAALAGGAKIATGTYTGTGEYGQSHPNILTFDFAPKLVIVSSASRPGFSPITVPAIGLNGAAYTGRLGNTSSNGSYLIYWTFEGNSVSWFSETDEYGQMNVSNQSFFYLAIG